MQTVTTTTTTTSARTLAVRAGQVARQGDVLLVPCRAAPTWRDWARVGPDGAVLVEGRAAHVLRGDAEVARTRDDPLTRPVAYVRVGSGGAMLRHERGGAPAEHAALALAPGAWAVMAQRVCDVAGDIRRALD